MASRPGFGMGLGLGYPLEWVELLLNSIGFKLRVILFDWIKTE